ncbi:hypothetical protein CC78DRAFT_584894 [Lojkania enalia]|uniref:Uncharacterized protein n=1 Tax=Lojkania enalia TaxID=147567 RepID=A0A9P4JZX9_9PLEO|nr:hypothetical protein CC78DRAFT_584894 [Didymosphaeria enalia]
MPSLYDTTPSVKGIFSFHVIVAGLALIGFITACALVLIRFINGRIRSFHKARPALGDGGRDGGYSPLKTTLGTHLFLVPAFFCLSIAYAVEAGVVGLDIYANAPASVTSPYAYPYAGGRASSAGTSHGAAISILSFTFSLAKLLMTTALTGAVWLHSNNLTNNGTGVNSPSKLSKIWNAFWLTAILAFSLASWGEGLWHRGGGRTAQTFGGAIRSDYTTRVLFIVYRCIVIFISTSVSIEVLLNYFKVKRNGISGNTERPILARFAFVVVPLIWLRNCFIVADIVMIYEDYRTWSRTTNQAIAFLFIIFGQLANLAILYMVLWGAYSMGRSAGGASGVSELYAALAIVHLALRNVLI